MESFNKQYLKIILLYVLLIFVFFVTWMVRSRFKNEARSLELELTAYQSGLLLDESGVQEGEPSSDAVLLDEKRVTRDQDLFLKFLDETVLTWKTPAEAAEVHNSLLSSLKLEKNNSFLAYCCPLFSCSDGCLPSSIDWPVDDNDLLKGYTFQYQRGDVTFSVTSIEEDVYHYIAMLPLTMTMLEKDKPVSKPVYCNLYVTFSVDEREHIRNLSASERYEGALPETSVIGAGQKDAQTDEEEPAVPLEATTQAMPSAEE